jgi:hypothetical protein
VTAIPAFLGRRVLLAAILAGVTGTGTACAFGPPVTCNDPIRADDCRRAVEMARPLMAAYWNQASEVLVLVGPCTLTRSCSPRRANDPGYLTVDLVTDQREAAVVVIDRRNAEWTATCAVTVRTADGAHGATCAEQ